MPLNLICGLCPRCALLAYDRRAFAVAIVLLPTAWSAGQSTVTVNGDTFTRADSSTVGNGWSEAGVGNGGRGQIANNALRFVTGGSAGISWVRQDHGLLGSTLSGNPGVVTWSFNMRQSRADPSGFDGNNYGSAFILAGTANDLDGGNGYAVVVGQSGATDPVRLVRYAGGVDLNSNLTNVISATGTGADIGSEYLNIRVTYDPSTDGWQLFGSTSASAFSDPTTESNLWGSATNSTHTSSTALVYGALYRHSNGASENADFDSFEVRNALPASYTWTANRTVLRADLTGNSEYAVNSAVTITVTGPVTESGGSGRALTKSGSGTLVLGSDSAYTGATSITAGTLQIGNGGASGGPGSGDITNNANLAFNRTGTVAVANIISGTGNVYQNGTGVVSLESDNLYQGVTVVNAGTLRVNAVHTGGAAYTVKSGGTLGGSGNTGAAVTVESGGTLAPGNSIGVLTVAAIDLDPGSTYAVELNTTAGNEAGDRTNVSGTGGTTLGDGVTFPALQFVFTPGVVETYALGKAFVIVQNTDPSATITGRFAGPTPVSGVQTVVDGLLQYAVYYGTYSGTIYGGGVNSGGNDIVVEFTSVPEPGAATVLALSAAALLRRRRGA